MDGERHDGGSSLAVSSALVAGLALVHLGMAYSFITLPDLVHDLVEPISSDSVASLVEDLLPLLPLALVVLGVARTLLRGCLACALVIALALVTHAASGWIVTALLAFGAALAWGVARRHGTWWPAGLVVAPVVALLFRCPRPRRLRRLRDSGDPPRLRAPRRPGGARRPRLLGAGVAGAAA